MVANGIEASEKVKELMDKGLLKPASSIYQLPDNITTFAKYCRSKGGSIANAVHEAIKWGMDFSDIHPVIRSASRFYAPFVTY